MRQEQNQDRTLVHKMNMSRRKQMQNHYKQLLVDDLMEKEQRKLTLDRQRKDQGKASANKN